MTDRLYDILSFNARKIKGAKETVMLKGTAHKVRTHVGLCTH